MTKLIFNFFLCAFTYFLYTLPAYSLTWSITRPPEAVSPNTTNLGTIVNFIINLLVVVGIIASLAYLIYGGIKWITSGGDKNAVEGARSHVVAAIIGLAVVLLSFVILNVVISLISGGSLQTTFTIPSL